jgi:hypothetical protein
MRRVGGPLVNRALWDNPIKMMAILKSAAKRATLTVDGMISFRKIDNFSIPESTIHTDANITGSRV